MEMFLEHRLDDFVYDISKAAAKLGINPKVSIERGLVDEILWHKKQI